MVGIRKIARDKIDNEADEGRGIYKEVVKVILTARQSHRRGARWCSGYHTGFPG